MEQMDGQRCFKMLEGETSLSLSIFVLTAIFQVDLG